MDAFCSDQNNNLLPAARKYKSDRRGGMLKMSFGIRQWSGLVLLTLLTLPCMAVSLCTDEKTCGGCIRKPGCAWCSQPDFNDTTRRCDTLETLNSTSVESRCPAQYLEYPKNETIYLRNDEIRKGSAQEDTIQVQPQKISVKLRVGEPYRISFNFVQAKDYPLDLYYLMDLSNSMSDDKRNIAQLGANLTEAMRNVTTDFRIGFGAFVDKTTMPFVSTSPKKLQIPCPDCAAPFSFRHVLSLTADTDQFSTKVENSQISGNLDNPEGGFDGLMQAIVCEREIGWRKNARRLIIFSTDAPFHLAGDGKLGGILDPNDGRCHLNSDGEYTHSTLLDYPSIAQINSKVQEKSITLILAVTQDQLSIYKELSKAITGSTWAKLSSDSSNVVDLVKEEYLKITSELKLRDNLTDNGVAEISYFVNCGGGQGSMIPGNNCSALKVGQSVLFQAELRITKCPENRADWKQTFDIQVIGIEEKLTVDLELACECGCEDSASRGYQLRSPLCDGAGTSICGICSCDSQHYGTRCQCDSGPNSISEEGSPAELLACQQDPGTNITCSNRGDCTCGECHCRLRENRNEKIDGKYCQCDNYTCRQVQGQLCSGPGHGTCVCKNCVCETGWSGSACECSTAKDGCFEPGGSSDICNGKGKCRCNRCECDRSSSAEPFTGRYCENCPSCRDKCSQLAPCIQCRVHKTGDFVDAKACDVKCLRQPEASIVDVATIDEVNVERYCSFEDETDGCTFFMVYGYSSSGKLYVNAQKEKYCPLVRPLTGIIGGVVLGTLIIGLIIMALFKLAIHLKDKQEFAKFEQERALARFDKGENPLYKDPNSTFFNPGYGRA